jgi:hypothetical protein
MADFEETSHLCPRCNEYRLFRRTTMGCTAHILLTFFTAFTWVIIYGLWWMLNAPIALMFGEGGWHCQQCGKAIRIRGPV